LLATKPKRSTDQFCLSLSLSPCTVQAPNFVPHGNFGLIFASSLASSYELFTKNEQNKFLDLKFFYNFYSLHFSVGCVPIIASASEKEVQTFHEVQSYGI
jgi:hypothetical protein